MNSENVNYKSRKYSASHKLNLDIDLTIFLGVLILLVGSWYILQHIVPTQEILAPVPKTRFEQIKYLGDNNLIYRSNALYLQNAGDTFGRVTGLRNYDYKVVYNWLKFLETFDAEAHYTPALASYYFGVTNVPEDLRVIMQFLEEDYDLNPAQKWWWMYIAVHIANHKLKDVDKALELAKRLSVNPNPDVPKWAREMPAFILEKKGELDEALKVIKSVAEQYEDFSQSEINFMNYFIKERLGFAKEQIKKISKINDVEPRY